MPIITFINKVDREGRAPFELLDEIADMLALDVAPMSWPVGMGGDFQGVYDLATQALSAAARRTDAREFHRQASTDAPSLPERRLREEVELARAAIPRSISRPIAMAI